MKLLENATKAISGQPYIFTGGLATVYCWGNFGGATVKLRVSPDSTNWFDVDGFTFTEAPNPKNLNLAECWMKGEISDGDGETNVNLVIKKFAK